MDRILKTNTFIIKANVIFFDIAKVSFRFPRDVNMRTSFWLLGANASIFSEIQFDMEVDRWQVCEVSITVPNIDMLEGKIYPGVEFKLGLFPQEFAYGKIIEVKTK